MKLRHFLLISLLPLFVACTKQNVFQITGDIDNAAGQTVYLEHMSLLETNPVDSAIISSQGTFKFKSVAPAHPDIYRLRLGNKNFVFPVDSCESIHITASAEQFDRPSQIDGSEKVIQMQELRIAVAQLQKQYHQNSDNADSIQSLLNQVEQHKQKAKQIILQNPRSIVASYALFQKIGDFYIFTPYDKEDRKFFAAVATAFHTFMPNYNRTENLYNWVLEIMQEERMERNQNTIQQMITEAQNGFLDIQLFDIKGQPQSLSSLVGNVFLLDFSLATHEDNIAYTFDLREIYNQFQNQGFQIYQVSVDANKLLWEQSVSELPWISVTGSQEEIAKVLQTYNITHLPSTFLFDKTGEIVGKNIPLNLMPQKIQQLLAQ